MADVYKIGISLMEIPEVKLYGVRTVDLAQYGGTLDEAIKAYCKAENATHRGHIVFDDCAYIAFESNG